MLIIAILVSLVICLAESADSFSLISQLSYLVFSICLFVLCVNSFISDQKIMYITICLFCICVMLQEFQPVKYQVKGWLIRRKDGV
ncbi:hypothetical protein I592_04164 [Enterococcus gilvus ATCC BAA-350]|uniref:Uncharacterized protein n=1 Tax=Enterococcus gilvus ATCC BAA-350 TaxID=1158614 RepID=R2V1B3_9ENTE|nr:hypothetical protein UKC_04176 [Enterococcus gilvus ATCC BAA-350]EOW77188.1 hypothetical protein I592_04164 [Enterococcus gilvus ATCC BAA-350]